MPRETVVDVGDGACTVLRCWHTGASCGCQLAVLDCGTYLAASAVAAERLKRVLGDDLARVGALMVSHFDADHWGGFRRLAPALAAARSGRVDLLYPRVPSVPTAGGRTRSLPGMTLALAVTAGGSGVRPLELERTLRGVGLPVRPRPLHAGNRVVMAGREFEVFWPPKVLDPATARLLERVIRRTNALADDMADHGHPVLRKNLDTAYEIDPFADVETDWDDDEDGSTRTVEFEDDGTSDGEMSDGNVSGASNSEIDDVEDLPLRAMSDELGEDDRSTFPDVDVPPEYRAEFEELLVLGRRASNDVSLIIGDENGHFAAFGDARFRIQAYASASMQDEYDVILAPHHGTFPVPGTFPRATMCVSQAGSTHAPRLSRHVARHGQPRSCISTYRVGTVSAW